MYSTGGAGDLWEIVVVGPGGAREVVDLCQAYESRGEAERAAHAIGDWFVLGYWCQAVLDRLPEAGQETVFALRRGLVAQGADMAAVDVLVRAEGSTHFAAGPLGTDDDDDGFDDDLSGTPLEVVGNIYTGRTGPTNTRATGGDRCL